MPDNNPAANERSVRIALMMQQYSWAKQRRLMKAAMTVWRRKTTREKASRRASRPDRVH
ncbi:MAG: hypothetical protein ABI818_05460 [Acidobacteriota bacterium]